MWESTGGWPSYGYRSVWLLLRQDGLAGSYLATEVPGPQRDAFVNFTAQQLNISRADAEIKTIFNVATSATSADSYLVNVYSQGVPVVQSVDYNPFLYVDHSLLLPLGLCLWSRYDGLCFVYRRVAYAEKGNRIVGGDCASSRIVLVHRRMFVRYCALVYDVDADRSRMTAAEIRNNFRG